MSDEATDIHTLSGAYALDALEPSQAAAFRRHLESCAECRDEIRSFNSAVTLMAEDAAEAPPARLRASILDAIADIRPMAPTVVAEAPVETPPAAPTEQLAPVVQLSSRRPRKATAWLAVAAAVLSIAMAGAVWRSVSLQTQVTELSASASQLNAVLAAPDAQTVVHSIGGARATVVMSESEGDAFLLTQGMAPAPAGSTYQVWYVGQEGTASSAGFIPTGSNTTTHLTGDPATAAAIGVTLEPEGGSSQPTTKPVMVVALPATA